jgi:hypothetical protein
VDLAATSRERKSKGTKLDNQALFRPVIIQPAAVLEAVKVRPGNARVCLYGGATADLDSLCARRRPKSRSGRKKACGAVEQKKGGQIKKARKQARNFLH